MTASARPRHGLKSLAAVLFPLALILALLALDEPAAVSAWTRASQAIQTAATGAWTAARGQWTRSVSPSAPASVSGDAVLQGAFPAADDRTRNQTGDVDFVRAELRFAQAGVLKTRPHRIAFGRQAADRDGATFADRFAAGADDQIELRQVLAGSSARLCGDAAPGWIGLRQTDRGVTLMAFRAGPAPGPTASPEAPCAVLNYVRP